MVPAIRRTPENVGYKYVTGKIGHTLAASLSSGSRLTRFPVYDRNYPFQGKNRVHAHFNILGMNRSKAECFKLLLKQKIDNLALQETHIEDIKGSRRGPSSSLSLIIDLLVISYIGLTALQHMLDRKLSRSPLYTKVT